MHDEKILALKKPNMQCAKRIGIAPQLVLEIDSLYEELKLSNAIIIEGIVKRVYGSREFAIKDCDGHTILIGD